MASDAPLPPAIDRADQALPLARAVADADADRLIRTEPISCSAGCSACCVQAVPVRPAEVRSIRQHLAALDADEREAVEGRIEGAVTRLRDAGISEPWADLADPAERRAMVRRYFEAGVSCPFLTDAGTCGIRPVRAPQRVPQLRQAARPIEA